MKHTLTLFCSVILCSCQTHEESLFNLIPSAESGVTFANTIVENEQYNVFDYHNLYNGGGVGIADLNNDGLPDLYFTGNMVNDKIYLNKGDFQFEDITQKSGIIAGGWSAGVSMVDINNDGLMDIYVSKSGNEPGEKRANQLYINQGNLTFSEEAKAYGIADTSYTNQAAFFDYDKDGDLDLYLLNTSNLIRNANLLRKPINDGTGYASDKLYQNNGDGYFKDVTVKAGILTNGHGLGLSIGDVNNDGWEDILASSDFLPNDALYINNQDGTFTDKGGEYFAYQSRFSIGNDIADINNDGWADVIMTDMLPEKNEQQKKMLLTSYQVFEAEKELGYHPEFTRNMLHINQGKTPDGRVLFSEIGQLNGINATDWSWAPLIADFDNDGNRDLFISNGYYRDVTNSDFVAYNMSFVKQAQTQAEIRKYIVGNSLKLPSIKRKNHFFKNMGGVDLQDITSSWDNSPPSFSNGAAYGDLDNDGDLDMVISNINQAAFILRNNSHNNFIQLDFEGSERNVNGLGTDIQLFAKGKLQSWHHSVVRGYLSSIDNTVTIGTGEATKIDSLLIRWPDGKQQKIVNIPTNQKLTLNHSDASSSVDYFSERAIKKWFSDISNDVNINYKHIEERYIDYNAENLLLHKLSQQGPKLAKGDINNDGWEDFIIGGSYGHFDELFLQSANGTFNKKTLSTNLKTENRETIGLELFDADNDGDLDIYLVSGSNEFVNGSNNYQDELLLNDGSGTFSGNVKLPKITSSGSCVVTCDFDKDGDVDIFRGGRLTPLEYPKPGRSFLLINEGVSFTEKTPEFLKNIGMVTDVKWIDVDNDSWTDLIVVGEYMPITIIYNKKGKLQPPVTIPNTEGLWNCIKSADLDNDGDMDFIAGNIGLNTRYKFSVNEPLRIYGLDYDNNGRFDAIPSYYLKGTEYPISTRDDLLRQIPSLRNRFPSYAPYAEAKFGSVLTPTEQKNALITEAKLMESCLFVNDGSGSFTIEKLPAIAQWAPVQDLLLTDINNDSFTDIIIVGNAYDTEPATSGFHGASVGLILLNSLGNKFTPHTYSETGFVANGDNKSIISIRTFEGKQRFVISQNSDKLLIYEKNE